MEQPGGEYLKEADEINLLDYVKVIWKHKILIIFIVCIVTAATAIISLLQTPIYEAKAVIIPSGVVSKDTGPASFLASQFGIAPPTTPISAEIVNILKSLTLKEKIINRYNLLPLFFGKKPSKEQSGDDPMWAGIRYLASITKVNFIQRDNIVEISIQFNDPKIVRDLVNYTLAELNEHMSYEAKRVANTNKKYLEVEIDKVADPFIRAKIYGLIAQQIETVMMAELKENFAFKMLDSPRIPDRRIKPKRTQMVLIAFIVAFFLGVMVAFVKEYTDKIRNKN